MRNFSQFKEATVTSSLDRLTDAELKAKEQREKRKPSSATQTANKAEADQVSEREKFQLAKDKVENRKRENEYVYFNDRNIFSLKISGI